MALPSITLPPPSADPSLKKRAKSKIRVIHPTVEERLESFMDVLSTSQLVYTAGIDDAKKNAIDECDWIQKFCENIVETQYVPVEFTDFMPRTADTNV